MTLSSIAGAPRVALAIVTFAIVAAAGLDPASANDRPAKTERVSVHSDGQEAQSPGANRGRPECGSSLATGNVIDITPDGRHVAFVSTFSDLIDEDTNRVCDVFMHDRDTSITERVSISNDGSQGSGSSFVTPTTLSGDSFNPSISANGRYVAFASGAINLVPGDTNFAVDIFVRDRKRGSTERVSLAPSGAQATTTDPRPNFAGSDFPAISPEGRFVAFDSLASNLAADDDGDSHDVFVHDRKTGKTDAISFTSSGHGGEGPTTITKGGRMIGFKFSVNDNTCPPAPGDEPNSNSTSANSYWCIYDTRTEETESLPARFASISTRGDNYLSTDGRFVMFTRDLLSEQAEPIIPNDSNARNDVYVYDRQTERVERVSVTSTGAEGDGGWLAETPLAISPDGRFALFGNASSNFAKGETNHNANRLLNPSDSDAFVYDRKTGALEWLTVSYEGKETQGFCLAPFDDVAAGSGSLSARGRFVSFYSCAENLVTGDTNGAYDVFVRDRGLPLFGGGVTSSRSQNRVSVEGSARFSQRGTLVIDDSHFDARYSSLGNAAELIDVRVSYRPRLNDLYVVLELDSLPSTPALATVTAGAVYGMSLEIDGRPYEIRIATTGLGPNGETTATFGLFSCPRLTFGDFCRELTALNGGFGTTGGRITISVPLDDLGVKKRSTITDLSGFSALGSYLGGASEILDEVTP